MARTRQIHIRPREGNYELWFMAEGQRKQKYLLKKVTVPKDKLEEALMDPGVLAGTGIEADRF